MYFIRKICSLILLLSICVVNSQSDITGNIKDKNDTPLLGVNVILKGMAKGAVSDFDKEIKHGRMMTRKCHLDF